MAQKRPLLRPQRGVLTSATSAAAAAAAASATAAGGDWATRLLKVMSRKKVCLPLRPPQPSVPSMREPSPTYAWGAHEGKNMRE